MGASYAQKLNQLGHTIYGYDINKDVISQAQEEGIVNHDNDLSKLMTSDVIILALYPKDNISFISSHQHLFKEHALVTDISGVKRQSVHQIERILRTDLHYVSHHPMAGRAKKGFQSKDSQMFLNNNVIIIDTPRATEEDYKIMHHIVHALGFKKIITLTPEAHDEVIAFTSQLTHAIAVSLMDSQTEVILGSTGDSFRDLTRIANINEELWSELFLENKEFFIKSIETFQDKLTLIKQHVMNEDKEALKNTLKQARLKRESFEKHT